jgi:hypothetical protein
MRAVMRMGRISRFDTVAPKASRNPFQREKGVFLNFGAGLTTILKHGKKKRNSVD